MRQRNAKKSGASKTARLEEKLDDLVSLLRTGAQPGANPMPAELMPQIPELTPATTTSESSLQDSPASSYHDEAEPSPEEAEACLIDFCTNRLQYLPFINVPPTATAHQLRQELPFLWLCIMMITAKNTARERVLDRKFRHLIGQEMLVKGEKSMDLLLALLAHLSWYFKLWNLRLGN